MEEDVLVRADDVRFKKVKEMHGWLSNMSPHKLKFEGDVYHTAEHLFQVMRFGDEEIRAELRGIGSPMSMKMRAKRYAEMMVVEPRGPADLANMEVCLRLKLAQHERLRRDLMKLSGRLIVEDIGNRGGQSAFFWGARAVDGRWVGQNVLGKLWMKLCQEVAAAIAS